MVFDSKGHELEQCEESNRCNSIALGKLDRVIQAVIDKETNVNAGSLVSEKSSNDASNRDEIKTKTIESKNKGQ